MTSRPRQQQWKEERGQWYAILCMSITYVGKTEDLESIDERDSLEDTATLRHSEMMVPSQK